ncbi:MAG: DUF898 domain-containing protein [Proteobacteria bacterium]|nr:DUF898 domain-containing protein [Pseudomonadota bacterium]
MKLDTSQIEDGLRHIDRQRFPLNYRKLTDELARRRAQEQATMAPTPVRAPLRFEFRGETREYFRIWIVNLALTIVTLGVYSAWAKVRRQRYFHSNTFLAGSAFGYHADPVRILIGRAIAAVLVGSYFVAVRISVVATLAAGAVIFLALPWLVVKSRMFSARVTSWRGLRFNFRPDYRRAYLIFAGGLILTILTLGLFAPRMSRERYRFIVTRTSYADTPFESDPGIGRFYQTTFGAIGLAVGVGIFVMMFMTALIKGLDFNPHSSHTAAKVVPLISLFFNYAILGPVVLGYTQSRNLNEVLNHTTLGPHAFSSALGAQRLIGLYLGNVFAIVGTLGMLTPWAEIRLMRYRLESVQLLAGQSLDDFVARAPQSVPAAAAEELASFLDLDFGF